MTYPAIDGTDVFVATVKIEHVSLVMKNVYGGTEPERRVFDTANFVVNHPDINTLVDNVCEHLRIISK